MTSAVPAPRVFLRSHDGFVYSLAPARVSKSTLSRLFLLPPGDDPICLHVDSLDEVRPHPETGLYALAEWGRYVVLPASVIDSEEDEPEEYRAGRGITGERAQKMREAVRDLVESEYTRLHPEIFSFNEEILSKELREAAKRGNDQDWLGLVRKESDTKIFSLDFFTPEFTRKLVEEIENFEASGLPVSRPNSMNNYGVILHDLGFSPLLDVIVLQYLKPLARLLYPNDPGAQEIDSHHSFIVQYKMNEDLDLDFHYDDSDVTLNVCLGKEFTGGELYFMGLFHYPETHKEDLTLGHTPGRGFIHLGQHRHGAKQLRSGARYNLIVWGRNNALREEKFRIIREMQNGGCTCGHHHGHDHDHSHEPEPEPEPEPEHDHDHEH